MSSYSGVHQSTQEAMDVVTEFLENSSIAGVGLIAQTRAFRKAFWVCVVIAGFTAGGCLVHQNFENWAENPVTTTVETLPITDIIFPKVTICPPANTYTNLNHDLMSAGNKTLLDDMKDDEEAADEKFYLIAHDLTEKVLKTEF